MNSPDTKIKVCLRAAWQPQLFIVGVLAGSGLALVIKGILSHREDLITDSSFCIVLGIGFALWFRAFRLELDDANLVYQAPLSKMMSIPVDNLQKVTTQRIVLSAKIQSFSYQSIIVESKNNTPVSFTINARIFHERKLIDLLNELASRNVSVIFT